MSKHPKNKKLLKFKPFHFGLVQCQAGLASAVTSPGGLGLSTSSAMARIMGWAPNLDYAVSAEETPISKQFSAAKSLCTEHTLVGTGPVFLALPLLWRSEDICTEPQTTGGKPILLWQLCTGRKEQCLSGFWW